MNSAIKHSAENNLQLRVETAKAKRTAEAEATAQIFFEDFGGTLEEHREYFITEAENKAKAKEAKTDMLEFVPSWMTPRMWQTKDRREIAKLSAYGLHRVIGADDYEEFTHAKEEHRHYNSDKPAIYVTASGFHRDPRPSLTKKGAWTE